MKIIFKNTTGVTFTQLKSVAASDDLRPAMQGAYIDFKESKIVVTDAHIMVCYPIEITENDSELEGIIVPLMLFNQNRYMTQLSAKDLKQLEPEFILSDDYAEVYFAGELLYRCRYIEHKFPKWAKVMLNPADRKPIDQFGLNIKTLAKLLKGLPNDGLNNYKFSLFQSNKGIHFEQTNKDKIVKITGLLMPVAIYD